MPEKKVVNNRVIQTRYAVKHCERQAHSAAAFAPATCSALKSAALLLLLLLGAAVIE